ncbi:hypothetical protein BH23PAT2_BH23PAT2_06820 [soil metagenome]
MSEINMSEFEQQWPISWNLRDHERYTRIGLEAIRYRLILPEDGRWDIAYGGLVMGSGETSVLAEGEPGSGKTEFGNIVMGESVRIDIASTDTSETLEGYTRPTDGEYNLGKMGLKEENVRLFLNEISHLRDTGPLHKYWDGESLNINGEIVDTGNVSTYATTNFADGRRAKELDSALRSRFGISVLAGDNVDQVARAIQSVDIGRQNKANHENGLLPPVKSRQQIREGLQERYPLDRKAGEYITHVIEGMNNLGITQPINPSDARIGRGWQQAERARRLVEGSQAGEVAIKPEDLFRVASLALGSIATLSSEAGGYFQEKLGKIDRLSPLEKAVITRRTIAAVAFMSVLDMNTFVKKDSEENMVRSMNERSYAYSPQSGTINEAIVTRMHGSKKPVEQEAKKSHDEKSRGFFKRRSQ